MCVLNVVVGELRTKKNRLSVIVAVTDQLRVGEGEGGVADLRARLQK